jgi:hypothetical protein
VTHHIQILFFQGCPNIDGARIAVRSAIERVGLKEPIEVAELEVRDEEHAQKLGFLGSPTVRVDGRDVDPLAAHRSDFGLQCRVYAVNDRTLTVPPIDWIAAALRPGCSVTPS